jgi:hypothetical protein
MTSSVNDRAQKLVELEKEREADAEARRREQQEASRLADARSRIKRNDQERERERARKAAKVEADALAVELGERAITLQREAEALHASIENYAELRGRLLDAERRAGREVGGGRTTSLRYVLGGWFKSVFGGQRSLVELPSELSGRVQALTPEPRTLLQRDNLASTRTNTDAGEAS